MGMAPKHASTRSWSCSTLADGVDALMEQAHATEDEEHQLAQLVKDFKNIYIMLDLELRVD